jgi:GntR family transcriptional regulator, transcriptional repressor for pyruvate dehydrogenase complex
MSGVRAPKTAELIAAQLRQRIARGELCEGDALPSENQLMNLLGVSRPILREAFRILESEALIEVHRGVRGGARVRLPDSAAVARSTALLLQLQGTTLADVLEARGAIEPTAARMVAEHRSAEVLANLRAVHNEELNASDEVRLRAMASARFHDALVNSCGNRSVVALIGVLSTIIDHHHALVAARLSHEWQGFRAPYLHLIVDGHGRLLELIDAGDGRAAEQLWREHMREARQWTDQLLKDNRSTTLVELLAPDA